VTRTRSYSYTVVDVFTTEPLSGNSLAVFPEASEFDAAAMQKIARELNLTETAFVLPPTRSDCAAPVRIFMPAKETPFAGPADSKRAAPIQKPGLGSPLRLRKTGIGRPRRTDLLLASSVSATTGKSGRSAA
jgi:PhzF family phenazine biosynthesis protein